MGRKGSQRCAKFLSHRRRAGARPPHFAATTARPPPSPLILTSHATMMARTLNAKTTKAGKATAPRRAVRARAAETNDTPPPAPKAPTFVDAMGFSGPAPEKINGRLAMVAFVAAAGAEKATMARRPLIFSMVAFVAAAGAELSSHESVAQQFGDAPLPIVLTAVTFAVASLVPILKGAIDEPAGPFNSNAEMLNGRVAMLGLAGLLVIENGSGQAFF